MNAVTQEGSDLSFEITELEVAFKQGVVPQGLMSPVDLALSLGVIRCPARMLHAVVVKKARFFSDMTLITPRLQKQVQGAGHELSLHVCAQLHPAWDVAVQY